MTNEVFTDKRLLGALDYIDERFIAEVTESYTFEAPGEYKRDKKTVFRAYRQFVALAACLLLISAAFPVVGKFLAGKGVNLGGWGGNAGAGSDVIETPPPTATEALETEPELTESDLIDSDFDKYLEVFADMSAEEIYAEVLKGGWVVIGEDRSDFTAGGELWLDFFEKSQKGEPAVALIAKYSPNYSRDDINEAVILLTEIVYNGDLFYHKCIFSLTNEIDSQGEYKYLRYSDNNQEFPESFAFLTNQEDISWSDLRDHFLSSVYVPDLELFNEFNYLIFHLYR